MQIALIVAAAENNIIGCDNQLPWHLPKDLQYFKSVTMGKPIIMGRKTFDSIGRPLPGRVNIVVTRQAGWCHEGVEVASSLPQAMSLAEDVAVDAVSEVMVIGGAQIYAEAFALADKIYLTRVHAEVAGDASFPVMAANEWRQLSCQRHEACERNKFDYSFSVLQRI